MLTTNSHSVFSLKYCLVLTTKYCRPVINDDIADRIVSVFHNASSNYNIDITEVAFTDCAFYIIFTAHPNTQISKFINACKSASSRVIKTEFPQICDKLYKRQFWSQSFMLQAYGELNRSEIAKYIESQKGKGVKD